MKAWTAKDYGRYQDQLTLGEQDRPKLPPDSARVKVSAASVIFADLLTISGQYQIKPPTPFIPGFEAAGTITEVGAMSDFKVGDRIVCANAWGAWTEEMVVDNLAPYRVHEAMSDEEAVAFFINYLTGYLAMIHRARLAPGEWLLVHGGAGGVGTAAIQLGKAYGAKVIATAGSEEKLQVCRDCGADHVINYAKDDFVEAVKKITDREGADVIYDPVGGEVFKKSTKCVAFEGQILSIGFASGVIPEVRLNRMLVKNFTAIGFFLGPYRTLKRQLVVAALEEMYALYDEGKLKPVICKVYPMEDLPKALEDIEQRKSYGKVILKP